MSCQKHYLGPYFLDYGHIGSFRVWARKCIKCNKNYNSFLTTPGGDVYKLGRFFKEQEYKDYLDNRAIEIGDIILTEKQFENYKVLT